MMGEIQMPKHRGLELLQVPQGSSGSWDRSVSPSDVLAVQGARWHEAPAPLSLELRCCEVRDG